MGDFPHDIVMGDLDADGDLDLVVANFGDDTVSVLVNEGDTEFAVEVQYVVGTGPTSLALGDFDGDDDLDVAVANAFSDDVSMMLNDGNGILQEQVLFNAHFGPQSVVQGDADGDCDGPFPQLHLRLSGADSQWPYPVRRAARCHSLAPY